MIDTDSLYGFRMLIEYGNDQCFHYDQKDYTLAMIDKLQYDENKIDSSILGDITSGFPEEGFLSDIIDKLEDVNSNLRGNNKNALKSILHELESL